MKRKIYLPFILVILLLISSCAWMGATNTTATNIAVTTYESAGATLKQAYNTEKMLLKAGTITAAQDEDFQLGVYTKAYTCYKALGSALSVVITTTDSTAKATAQEKIAALNAQLPGLVADVLAFIKEVKK